MDIITNTKTAWTPSFGMSAHGRPCAHARALGAGVTAGQDAALVVARVKGDRPGPSAWRPPMS